MSCESWMDVWWACLDEVVCMFLSFFSFHLDLPRSLKFLLIHVTMHTAHHQTEKEEKIPCTSIAFCFWKRVLELHLFVYLLSLVCMGRNRFCCSG